jgi:hypothetical protein
VRWAETQSLARTITPGEVPAAFQTARQVLQSSDFQMFRSVAIGEWAKSDPQTALNYAYQESNPSERSSMVGMVLTHWARQSPADALAWVEQLPKKAETREYLAAVLVAFAGTDPQLALSKLSEIPLHRRRHVQEAALDAIAETDPKKAMELAATLKSPARGSYAPDSGNAGAGVLSKWLKDNRDEALAWINAQPESVRKRTLPHALQRLSQEDPHAALELLSLLPSSANRESTLATLVHALAQRDPEKLLAWSQDSNSKPREKEMALLAYAERMAADDPKAAFEVIKNLNTREAHRLSGIFTRYAEVDQDGALAAAESLKGKQRTTALQGVLRSIADAEPLKALEYAENLKGRDRLQSMSEITATWIRSDPQKLAEWIKSNSGKFPAQAFQQMLTQVSYEQPELAAELFNLSGPNSHRANSAANIASALAQQDVSKALQWAAELPDPGSRRLALERAHSHWAGQDPEGAAAHIRSMAPGRDRERLIQQVVGNWANRSPEEAGAFLLSLDESSRQRALGSYVSTVAHQNPEAAVAFLEKVPDANKAEAMRSLAVSWAHQDPFEALKWAQSLPPTQPNRGEVLSQVVGPMAAQSPVHAATVIAGLDTSLQKSALQTAVPRMAESDPAFTAQWVQQFPEGDLRKDAERNLISSWARNDPQGALTWLDQAASPSHKNSLLQNYAANVAHDNPELAWRAAERISDALMMESAAHHAASQWLQSDRDAAQRAIMSSQLSAESKTRLLERVNR